MANLLQCNHILTLSNIPTYFFHLLKNGTSEIQILFGKFRIHHTETHSIVFKEFNLKLIYLPLMFKFMTFCIKSFLYRNKFRVNMIIIKTEMSVRKINRAVLGLVLSCLSFEACSKEGEGRQGEKKRGRGTKIDGEGERAEAGSAGPLVKGLPCVYARQRSTLFRISQPHNSRWELLE